MFDVRPAHDADEFTEAVLCIGQYFGMEPTPERIERFMKVLDHERMHAARDDGRIVGGAGAFTFEMTVPGGAVPTAGVTVVGVYPTHRRRGVLRAMMRAQLDDVHERGEPVAALWASEETIYGRFGYGIASCSGAFELSREYSAFARPLERRGTVRFVDAEEAAKLLPPIWDSVRAVTPGMMSRSPEWWELRVLSDPPDRREGGGPKRIALLELDGKPEGYAIYRHHPGWNDGVSSARLGIVEAIATDGQPTAELWRFLLDIDWQAKVSAQLLPVDHPLFFLLANPRRLGFRVGDGLWVRLVDVGAALAARAYSGDGAVAFELDDEFCPWNAGTWRLEGGEAARADGDADLRLDVQALGSAYLGAFTFSELARAGRVEELREGALERADAMFRASRAPWCPEIF
jgi:predicted acetyltransferase